MTAPAPPAEGRLKQRVRVLLEQAQRMCTDAGVRDARLDAARARFDEPLRVAIVGRVKAGKSTLLNALVGEFVAATDAAECTRVVTWYDRGTAYRAFKLLHSGAAQPAPFRRDDRSASIEIGTTPLHEIARLSVEFPSPWLTDLTLIDTPGIASLTDGATEQAVKLVSDTDRQRVDAVIYLMRNLHQEDFRFLDTFTDRSIEPVGPINSVAVLSRADEVGSGRTDALDQAVQLAEQWRRHPMLRPLVLTVLPVAGLVAESAATLRQEEFDAFRSLADAPIEQGNHVMRSVDDFVHLNAPPGIAVDAASRAGLLNRYGIFGVRIAVGLLRHGQVRSADELAQALFRSSGVGMLRSVVLRQFADRRDVIKAANALDDLESLLDDIPALASLEREIEKIRANAVDLDELRILTRLRIDPDPEMSAEQIDRIERLLGAEGRDWPARLGAPPGTTDPAPLRSTAIAELDRWRAVHSDLSQPPLARRAAETIERVLSQALAELTPTAPVSAPVAPRTDGGPTPTPAGWP